MQLSELKFFEDAYYKASQSSLPNDWLDAALLGKQLANAIRAQADARPTMWVALTDEDRKSAFESLPDMLEGFLKKWGWLNFAKEIERRCKEKNANFVREAITHPEASTGLRVFFDKEELDALYEAIKWAKDEGLPGTAEHLQAIFDAHNPEASAPVAWEATTLGYRKYITQSEYENFDKRFRKWYKPYRCSACAGREASAPGLSDAERAAVKGAIESITASGAHIDLNIVNVLQGLLTRASAATVGEPVREADYCTESNCRRCNTPKALRTPDMDHAGLGSKPQAAQQQAEPTTLMEVLRVTYAPDMSPEEFARMWPKFKVWQQAEPKCDDCNDTGQICVGTSGLESDGNAPLLERCPSCGYGEQQAETNRCNCAHVGECDGSCAPYVGQQAEPGAYERAAFWQDNDNGLMSRVPESITQVINEEDVPIGYAEAMPYCDDWTQAVFEADKVPEGTPLYLKAAQSGQRAGVAEDVRDAARYRKLRAQCGASAYRERHLAVVLCDWAKNLDPASTVNVWAQEDVDAERLDRLLDAAPTQQQEGGK